jgi:hypothetical protein
MVVDSSEELKRVYRLQASAYVVVVTMITAKSGSQYSVTSLAVHIMVLAFVNSVGGVNRSNRPTYIGYGTIK